MKVADVLIVGAGPAGLTTALQLRRYGLNPLIFERAEVGGLLKNANLVENYPGFPGGIPGPELLRLFKEHAERISVQVTHEEIVELSFDGRVFQATTSRGNYHSRVAVIASGTKPRPLSDLPIPVAFCDRVEYEVFPFLGLHGQDVAIIGAGDAAFDYALNLSRQNDIQVLNHGERVACLPLLWERASACSRITYRPSTRVIRIDAASARRMALECSSPAGMIRLQVDYLLVAVGRQPQLDFVSVSLLENAPTLQKQGVFYFVGDVKNDIFRQTAIAVGDGMLAAMQIYQLLKETAL